MKIHHLPFYIITYTLVLVASGCNSSGGDESDDVSAVKLLLISDEWDYKVTNSNCPDEIMGIGTLNFTVNEFDSSSYESAAYASAALNHISCTITLLSDTQLHSGSVTWDTPKSILQDAEGFWLMLPSGFTKAFHDGETGNENTHTKVPVFTDTFIQLKKTLSDDTITTISFTSSGDDGTPSTTFNGNTGPAAIDATNAEAIGTAAGESIQIADASTGLADLPVAIAISSPANMDQINNIVISAVNTLNLPTGVDVPGICNSGSVTASDNEPEASGEWNITITFNNCVVTEQNFSMTLNGTAVWHVDDINDLNTGFYITYKNFTVTDNINGGTTTINMTFACTDLENTLSCTYNSDFVGSDGVTHRVSDYTITGSADIGFSGSATFFHGTYGQVTITISGITYGGCGAIPDGGTLEFYSSDGSFGVITFHDDCTVSGSWTDSLGNSDTF